MAYEFDGSPIGPYYGPNKLLVVQDDEDGNTYQLNIFPDLFNDELRKAGKPLAFYYLPDSPRMARYKTAIICSTLPSSLACSRQTITLP